MQYVPVPSPTSSRSSTATRPIPASARAATSPASPPTPSGTGRSTPSWAPIARRSGAFIVHERRPGGRRHHELRGVNPYWRLALNREWGAHSLMVGTSGMVARVYDDPLDTSDPSTHAPLPRPECRRAVPVPARPALGDGAARLRAPAPSLPGRPREPARRLRRLGGQRAGATPTQRHDQCVPRQADLCLPARYGGSVGFFNLTGSTNTANQSSGFDPATLTITSDPAAAGAVDARQRQLSRQPGHPRLHLRGVLHAAPVPARRRAVHRLQPLQRRLEQLRRFRAQRRDNNSLFLYFWAAY